MLYVVTFCVFIFDKSIFIKFTQEANIQFILVAEDVSKLETSKTVSFLHPSNIPQKSLTCDVSNGIIKAVKEEQYSNIPVIHSDTMFENQIYNLFKLPYGIFRIKILNNYTLIERV